MTSFLIESYQNLRQSSMDLVVILLQQLVRQTGTYSINNDFLNSTSVAIEPMIPAFEPTTNAVRVNVLWFASLVLSLVSASFGILVKQWLREYLAGEYTSPQARLRIRHFRNPGLEHWKVFEIAAILPVLLQLSLALFLIGLCFFTLDVHDTIGHTTLPLVAGWAFLFISASFAPSLSPRCPYKTTLLKSVMKHIRLRLFRIVEFVRAALHWSTDSLIQVSGEWTYKLLAYDEEDAVLNEKNDVDILIAVDSIQSDEYLLSVMWDALQQTQVESADLVTFLLKAIGHRIQHDVTAFSSGFMDLKKLPKRTVTSIMTMVSDVLKTEINRQSPTNISKVIVWSQWMKDCVYILLAETNAPLTAPVNYMLTLCLTDEVRRKVFFSFIHERFPDPIVFSHVLGRLRGGLLLLTGDAMLSALQNLTQEYFCVNHNAVHNKLLDVLRDHPEIAPDHLQYLVDILIDALTNEMKPNMYWHPFLLDELDTILELSSNASWRDSVVKLVQTMLIQPRNTAIYIRYPMALYNSIPGIKANALELFVDAVLASNVSGKSYHTSITCIIYMLTFDPSRTPHNLTQLQGRRQLAMARAP